MLVSQTAEYALRAMAWLAAQRDDRAVSSAELAEAAQIPRYYVSKVMRRMVLAGLVVSRRGHGGGFRLARPRDQVTFFAVLEAVGDIGDESRCAFGLGACSPRAPCVLHPAWSQLKERFEDWARASTLESVGDPVDALRRAAPAGGRGGSR